MENTTVLRGKVTGWGAFALRLVVIGAGLVVAAGCAASSNGSAADTAHSVGAKATAVATTAVQRLQQDNYDKVPLAGFGHAVLGYTSKAGKPHWEAIYDVTGKDVNLVDDAVANAKAKLAGVSGVTITMSGQLIIVTAQDKQAALKALQALDGAIKATLNQGS